MRWACRCCSVGLFLRRRTARCARSSRVVLIPRRWYQVGDDAQRIAPVMVAKKPGAPGRARINRNAIARGRLGSRLYLWFYRVLLVAPGPRVRSAPGLPCALSVSEGLAYRKARALGAATTRRHARMDVRRERSMREFDNEMPQPLVTCTPGVRPAFHLPSMARSICAASCSSSPSSACLATA